MPSSGESENEKKSEGELEKHCAGSPREERHDTESIQKNGDLDERTDTSQKISLEVKSEISNTAPSDPAENGDTNIT